MLGLLTPKVNRFNMNNKYYTQTKKPSKRNITARHHIKWAVIQDIYLRSLNYETLTHYPYHQRLFFLCFLILAVAV